MNDSPVRVLCVDDHAFLVAGLEGRFSLETDLEFVGRLESADGLFEAVRRTGATVVLLDIEMPGPDPFDVLPDLRSRCPEVRVIMFSAHVRDHYLDLALESGAWGYLSKADDPDDVIDAIRKVAGGEFAFGPKVLQRCQVAVAGPGGDKRPVSKLDLLTPRELQILRMIGQGRSRTEIARAFHRSPKTVDNHRAAIMRKLGIHDRVELARFAIGEGLAEA